MSPEERPQGRLRGLRLRRRGQPAADRHGAAARRHHDVEAQPRRPGHRAGAAAAPAARGWVGWPGIPDARRRADRARTTCSCTRCSCPPTTSPSTTRASPTPPCGRCTTTSSSSRSTTANGGTRYVEVNRRFAEATAKAAAQGATVWVQDYQLQLVPKMLRMLRPDLTIGFFLHIPFPPVELFMQMPWRTEIIEGLLGADLVGFHLPGGAQNFLILARRLVGANTSRAQRRRALPLRRGAGRLPHRQGRRVPDLHRLRGTRPQARTRAIRQRAEEIRSELGNPRKILLGVDRLDYTKGIDVRLHAFSELLDEERADRADTVLVQLATPSRERVESYIAMREDIERQVGHINGEYGEVGHPIVHYLHRPIPRDELIAFFVAADVMLVTPLRDGMNLVAKEYVACRSDLGGALVLSEFTGAAAELRQAYLCNPHDLDGVKDAIEAA